MKNHVRLYSLGISLLYAISYQFTYAQTEEPAIVTKVTFDDEVGSGRSSQIDYLTSGIPVSVSQTEISLETIYSSVSDEHSNEILWRLCNGLETTKPDGTQSNPALIGTVIGLIAPELIGLFVGEVNEQLEDKIAKYTVTHRASQRINPYVEKNNGQDVEKNSGQISPIDTNLETAASCFRYSRYSNKDKVDGFEPKTDELLFDFLGQWRVSENQGLQIRPLRVFFGETAAPKKSKKVSFSINAKADAVWRDDNIGRSEEIFNIVIVTDQVNRDKANNKWDTPLRYYNLMNVDGSNYKDFDNSDWNSLTRLPIIPYSKGMSPGKTETTFEISITEVGDGARKRILRLASKGLNIFEDDITSALEEAASGLIGED